MHMGPIRRQPKHTYASAGAFLTTSPFQSLPYPDPANGRFGSAVALSTDQRTLVVGDIGYETLPVLGDEGGGVLIFEAR